MTENEARISIDKLRTLLRLDAETGALYWLERSAASFSSSPLRSPEYKANHWNSFRAGCIALNCITHDGYASGRIDGVFFFAHRVVFALHFGHWPNEFVDHISGDRLENRPLNLRDVSHLENHRNKSISCVNTSGVIGVYWSKQHDKWRASIKVDGKKHHLGLFQSIADAADARKIAEANFGFHQNHGKENHVSNS